MRSEYEIPKPPKLKGRAREWVFEQLAIPPGGVDLRLNGNETFFCRVLWERDCGKEGTVSMRGHFLQRESLICPPLPPSVCQSVRPFENFQGSEM